jgi:hypothetical protein
MRAVENSHIKSLISYSPFVVNPSTPQHNSSTALRTSCWGSLRVDPERCFTAPPKAGLGAAEWVKIFFGDFRKSLEISDDTDLKVITQM